MNHDFCRQVIVDGMRRRGQSLDEAVAYAHEHLGQMPGGSEAVAAVAEELRREQMRQMLLESPPMARGAAYHVESEAKMDAWYIGPEPDDKYWPRLADRMQAGALADAFEDVDRASTKVVAHLANPGVRDLKKKGLVVGHVQSGKTANYAAVIAKATDAGYRMVIVLSGMHNNLRKQTQQRLTNDVTDESWFALTDSENDFSGVHRGSALLVRRVPSLAVVKKNSHRLRWLRDFLRDIKVETRRNCPILLLDDEADQATPNSAKIGEDPTRINELVREVWDEIPSGSYVGYTATPFANVFMDPDDERELYPSDFILALEPGKDYFGAERVFGRFNPDDAEDGDEGLDIVRSVPEDDVMALKPPSDRESRDAFDPDLPESLVDAVRWFCLSVAVRSVRGQVGQHVSMLVHTTHFVAPHFTMRQRIGEVLETLTDEVSRGHRAMFESVWDREVSATQVPENFDDVWGALEGLLPRIKVVVDNGSSEDRLDYDVVDDEGHPSPQYVIAVGGGTLSRGLTLEGLVVSYFIRTASTYDTLLQMGRWFGYRVGYEDLPRVWMPDDLREEFRFLAQVEYELREEIGAMARSGVSPRQLGVKVRAHPGRLEITAATKMQHAELVRMSFSGQTVQTIQLHERESEVLASNREQVAELIAVAGQGDPWQQTDAGHWISRDVRARDISNFLAKYRAHESQVNWRPDLMEGWLNDPGADTLWNVVVFNLRQEQTATVDLRLPAEVRCVRRAPLSRDADRANIKALMSLPDRLLDLNLENSPTGTLDNVETRRLRAEHAECRGLLIIYMIDPESGPKDKILKTRRQMRASEPLVGVGLVFPTVDDWSYSDTAQYYSVLTDWHVGEGDVEDVTDTEGQKQASFEGAA
ncbi:Z1 domain-containing protein [Janibacter anophelis]|uniref:Z1 domain-containing protein n=1 Tax=Janibacter anophelis TaxID=319054 RepID=UPI003F8071A7